MAPGRSRDGGAAVPTPRSPQQQRRRAFVAGLALVAAAVGLAGLVPEPGAVADDTQVVMAAPPPSAAPPTTVAPPTTTATAAPTTTARPTTTQAPTTTVRPTTTTTTAKPATTTTTAPPAPAAPKVEAQVATPGGGDAEFLACLRRRESGGNYQAVSSTGLYFGAYQFMISTWDNTARHAGRGDLVGVRPDRAAPADQDAMALALYRWQGKAPWNGAC